MKPLLVDIGVAYAHAGYVSPAVQLEIQLSVNASGMTMEYGPSTWILVPQVEHEVPGFWCQPDPIWLMWPFRW